MSTSSQCKNDFKPVQFGKWTLLKILGTGATSTVYLGFDPETERYAAVKVFKKLDPRSLPAVKNEMYIQMMLRHEHVLKFQEYYDNATHYDQEGRNNLVTSFVIDYAKGGDILLLIQKIGVFPERLARTYFHQLISVLEYLHKNFITHRDIKPENIMLDADYCIKLSDFGCASKFSASRSFRTPIGTSKYFPPEEHLNLPYEGPAADLFATAIVVFAMVVGHMPFMKATPEDGLYSLIYRGKAQVFWTKHEEIARSKGVTRMPNKDFKTLMTKMFDPNPSKRLTIPEIKKSAWYNGTTLQKHEIAKLLKEIK